MRTTTPTKLKEILRKHSDWLRNIGEGEHAALSCADLRNANLRNAALSHADLRKADLSHANLRGANLRGAILHYANVGNAELSYATLRDADLRGTDLRNADLSGADLSDADLRGTKNLPPLVAARLSIVPETGAFTGWKQCRNDVIVKLLIPAEAARSNATGRKCRAEFVDVLEIHGADKAESIHAGGFFYEVGQRVLPDHWNPDRWDECSGGIHFYLTRAEAEAHC